MGNSARAINGIECTLRSPYKIGYIWQLYYTALLWLFYLFHFIWQWALFVVYVPRATLAALISILQPNFSIPSCRITFVIVSLVPLPLSFPPYLCLFLYVFNSLYLSYLPVMNFYALSLTFIVFISAFSRSFPPLLPRVCLPLFVVCFGFLQTF